MSAIISGSSATRQAGLTSLVRLQSNRPVFLGTLAISAVAAVLNFAPWTSETVGSPLNNVPYVPGALLTLSSTVDVNVRLIGQGTAAGSGTVTYSGSAGAQTITVAGRQVSFTAGASDTLTALAAVAALNADPMIPFFFLVTSAAGVVTIKALRLGTGGNVSLAATGTGATPSGAALTGGTNAAAGTTASNSFIVPAKLSYPVYTLDSDFAIDALAGGAGTLNVFIGV